MQAIIQNKNAMKKVVLCLFIAIATLATSGCRKLDKRDEFVGVYNLKIHGEIAYENGTEETIDRDNLTLNIEKADEAFKLNITGFYTCGATVVGNVIVLEETSIEQDNGAGGINTILIHESNGVFIDNTLTFVNEISGTLQGLGFDAWFSNEAMKQ